MSCVPSHYPVDSIPVVPFKTPEFVSNLPVRNKLTSAKTLKMTQLPFAPLYASTTYKMQGVSAAGVVAFPFIRGCPGSLSSAALYVTLSRVWTLKALFMSEPISAAEMKHFVPHESVVEQKRLDGLYEMTVKRHRN